MGVEQKREPAIIAKHQPDVDPQTLLKWEVSVEPEVVVFQEKQVKKTRAEIMEENRRLVEEAWEKGYHNELTERQRLVLSRYLYPDENGRILSIMGLQRRLRENGVNLPHQSLSKSQARGIRKLEKIRSREEKLQEEAFREGIIYAYETKNMHTSDIDIRLGLTTIERTQLMEIYNIQIQRKKRGKLPKDIVIEDPSLVYLVLNCLREQGMSYREIGEMVGWPTYTVATRIRRERKRRENF